MKPDMKKCEVTCMNCKKTSKLVIMNGIQIGYEDQLPIISARLRPDGNWGFECICGNDSRVALEEKDNLNFLIRGGDQNTIKRIADSLRPNNEKKFRMVLA